MSNLPWWVLLIIGAALVTFGWPILSSILGIFTGAFSSGGEKKSGA